jgi:hypothetical protein
VATVDHKSPKMEKGPQGAPAAESSVRNEKQEEFNLVWKVQSNFVFSIQDNHHLTLRSYTAAQGSAQTLLTRPH